MLGLKNGRIFIATALVLGTLIPSGDLALADTMSSANYKIQADVMSMGGGTSSSTNFNVDDSVGDLATGEDLTSTNFKACSGYECFQGSPYISFTVKEGTSAPGTGGAGVSLGTLSTSAVTTSNGSSVNSVFLTAESNASGGTVVTVSDANGGLKRTSTADTITSGTATLSAGTAGFGVCVFSVTQDGASPTAFSSASPFNGTCTKTSGHAVGGVTTSPQSILSSTGALKGGSSEVLVKAAISNTTASGNDYADDVTFIATATY